MRDAAELEEAFDQSREGTAGVLLEAFSEADRQVQVRQETTKRTTKP